MSTFFAYLDPITGSAIMQVLLAALAAIGLGWQYIRRGAKLTWAKLRGEDLAVPVTVVADETSEPEDQLNSSH